MEKRKLLEMFRGKSGRTIVTTMAAAAVGTSIVSVALFSLFYHFGANFVSGHLVDSQVSLKKFKKITPICVDFYFTNTLRMNNYRKEKYVYNKFIDEGPNIWRYVNRNLELKGSYIYKRNGYILRIVGKSSSLALRRENYWENITIGLMMYRDLDEPNRFGISVVDVKLQGAPGTSYVDGRLEPIVGPMPVTAVDFLTSMVEIIVNCINKRGSKRASN